MEPDVPIAERNTQARVNNAIVTLRTHSKYKVRSHDTASTEHIPYLQAHTSSPRIILFGNSMFERMKTTGESADGQPWPSPTMLSDERLQQLRIDRLDGVFNAGVGGDKIANNIYRLAGDQDRGLLGLLDVIGDRDIKLWVICCGTNDLHPKKGLREKDLQLYRVLLESLLAVYPASTRFLVEGISYRKDVPDELVDKANEEIQRMVEEGRAEYLPPVVVDKEPMLEDHVHLNGKGNSGTHLHSNPPKAEASAATRARVWPVGPVSHDIITARDPILQRRNHGMDLSSGLPRMAAAVARAPVNTPPMALEPRCCCVGVSEMDRSSSGRRQVNNNDLTLPDKSGPTRTPSSIAGLLALHRSLYRPQKTAGVGLSRGPQRDRHSTTGRERKSPLHGVGHGNWHYSRCFMLHACIACG
ncbi:hypothetical protein G7046_g9395 [Stylonectria norvegica]|nr:hypothetical protein G7046_g9395 [Stylonectria norvegica]